MKKLVFFFSAVFLLISSAAMATEFIFSYSGDSISGSGSLDATFNSGADAYIAESGSTTVTVNGINLGNFTLITDPIAPTYATSPMDRFYYNDALYLNGPRVDYWGLLFSDNTTELNIWNNGNYPLYSAWLGTQSGWPSQNNDVSFTAQDPTPPSTVPEPSTFLLFGAGIAGVVFSRKRMKK